MRFTVVARNGELAVCAALLALAGYAGFVSAGMPMGRYNLPGPGVFPLALAIMLGAASAVRIGWLLAHRDVDRDTRAIGHRNIVAVVLALAGVALALEHAGFVLTIAGFLAVLYRLLGGGAWWRVTIAVVLSVAGFWLFFERIVGLVLPRGELLPW